MGRGPRYIPRRYTIGGETHWRVYDTEMQVPHSDQYPSESAAKNAAKTRNRRAEGKGKGKGK